MNSHDNTNIVLNDFLPVLLSCGVITEIEFSFCVLLDENDNTGDSYVHMQCKLLDILIAKGECMLSRGPPNLNETHAATKAVGNS